MTHPPRTIGLRNLEARLLVSFLLVSLLPLAVTATLISWRSASLVERFVASSLQKTAEGYASGLDSFLARHRGRLRQLDLSRGAEVDLNAALAEDRSVEALWLHGSHIQAGATPAPWATAACDALSVDPTQVMTHAGEGHAHAVVVAVRRPEGLLCAQVTFTLHQDMLSEQATSILGGSAYIVDRDGVVVCHAFEESEPHVARGSQLSPEASLVAARALPWAALLGDGAPARFAAYAPASQLPWGVWVEIPTEQAVAPLLSALHRTVGYTALAALFAIAAAMGLSRRLGAPVRQVAAAVRRVAEGRYGGSVPVTGNDDVAELAADFNRMSEALARSHSELEERVAQRTQELEAARELSDLLLDSMQHRILVMDADLRVIRANEAALQAYGRDILGCGCRSIPRGQDLSDRTCTAQRVLDTGLRVSDERIDRRDGRSEVLSVETYPLKGGGTIANAIVEIAQDVTEIKRIRAQLAQQQKMVALGTLAAGLAHEIGNPLASMSSELEMLERMWDPEEARAAVPVLRNEIRRISGLLRELTDLGRRPSDQATAFSPADLLTELSRMLRHDPRSKGVEISTEAEADVRCLCTDRDRVVQVLVNLGLNALDALEGMGSLCFRLARDPLGGVRFEVADTGPGVAADVAGRVFDPFFTTKAPGQGTGLGLFVSERIAQELGGRIELQSNPAGATFTLVLPFCACEEGQGSERV